MDADKLRELNDRLLTCGNDYSDVLLDGAAEIERLRARVAELEAMREYVQHKKFCKKLDPLDIGIECTCGASAALAKEGE